MSMFTRGIGLPVGIALTIVMIWAAVDAALRPARAYDAIGHKKVYWVAGLGVTALAFWLPLLGLFALVGAVAAIVYLVEYRPKLRDISRRPSGGW
ncbi:MAG: hypothetical protein JWM93_1513 [Frankiales bacterium]|nr:hypothetical protein [Frankiales bacterium]